MKYRETEGAKVRRLGFALDEATLKQLAYSKGITQSYESMTQAQKAQLRYVAMIEQAQNIGVTGDMSRTIDTASNGVRVLEARISNSPVRLAICSCLCCRRSCHISRRLCRC